MRSLKTSGLGLPILEIREVGLENVRQVVQDAIEKAAFKNSKRFEFSFPK